MFCSNCGAEISDDAKFCWKCGEKTKTKTNLTSSLVEQHHEITQQPQSISLLACPSCGREDMVQNVDALVQGNTIRTRYSGSSSGSGRVQGSSSEFTYGSSASGSSTTQSTLARKLDFPNKTAPGATITSIINSGVSIVLLLPGVLVYVLIQYRLVYGILALLLWVGCSVLVLRIISKSMERVFEKQRTKWEAAQTFWKQLYYCSRDGTVFDPQTKHKIALSGLDHLKWRDFLFQ